MSMTRARALPDLAIPLALALATSIPLPAAENPPAPIPAAAHNCYPALGVSDARLRRALALGFDNIEIDLGWDPENRRLVVGHDPQPLPGRTYPEFAEYLLPALTDHLARPRPDRAPSVLTIDFKTAEPDAVRSFKRFLDERPDWFADSLKTDDPLAPAPPWNRRALVVCITGSERAKILFDELVPVGTPYRAFRDRVVSGTDAPPEVVIPERATNYQRFITLNWNVVEPGGPPRAGAWDDRKNARLREIAARARERGLLLRVYCLNGQPRSLQGLVYAFGSDDAARIRWAAARDAGVPFIATDDYEALADFLRAPAPAGAP